jgi:hypothetical protein
VTLRRLIRLDQIAALVIRVLIQINLYGRLLSIAVYCNDGRSRPYAAKSTAYLMISTEGCGVPRSVVAAARAI